MARTMTLADSRARAAEVYELRVAQGKTWAQIAEALGFRSIGAARKAYERHIEHNPSPRAEEVREAILARKTRSLRVVNASLIEAHRAGDYSSVARLTDSITRSDAELARLYGLTTETVAVTISASPAEKVDEERRRTLAILDAEVIDTQEIEP